LENVIANNHHRLRRKFVEIAVTVGMRESGPFRSMSKVEKEIVLMVDSVDPKATIQRVSKLNSLKGYSLRAAASFQFHDIYFETASGSLRRKRLNLRIRKGKDGWLITMKRSPGLLQWRRNERAELELVWSHESLDRILAELSAKGITLSAHQHLDMTNPVETMKSIGLFILQDRETERNTKSVSLTPEGGADLAELASDCVTYHFQRCDVRLYELEVEAKGSGSDKVLSDIRIGLLNTFGSELVPWNWGKLVTGKMIETLLKAGTLDDLFTNDLLTKRGIEEVEKALRNGSPKAILRQ